MEEQEWKLFWEALKKIYERHDGNDEAFNKEREILEKVLFQIEEKIKNTYDFIGPIDRGGAGVVIKLRETRLGFDRALKIPRPTEMRLIESVRNEIDHLKRVRHDNIINVYNLGEVEITDTTLSPYPYFVMDYIEDANDIKDKIRPMLEENPEAEDLKNIMKYVTDMFFKIANAVKYLHDQKIIHFDIKPSNIMIDWQDKPILNDLGFAKKKSEDDKLTVVGFTSFYAHPSLIHDYEHMSNKNRVRKPMAPKDFDYLYDIYAFGKSLLEILALIDQYFPDVVSYDYTFVYLHLAACRMLDGENKSWDRLVEIQKSQLKNGEEPSVYYETWQELDSPELNEIKYCSFKAIVTDLEKLIHRDIFLDKIPELDLYYPGRLQCSEGTPAPFSERVKRIIEHPVFSRLSTVPQLGLTSTIFPTATHNRLEHSVGVFRNCSLYIQALYNDPFNPLFKQLVNEDDIKLILLVSLIHDIGQYPLAHEIEESSNELKLNLKHEKFSPKFLDNISKDIHDCTIEDIIENQEWGWGLKLEQAKELLTEFEEQRTLERDLKGKLLRSLVDGPIDADKLDYLIRDSNNCFLTYGELIDFDRLIRNLTVIVSTEEYGIKQFNVGIYEKGQTAAESLTFARYLLYQSLYWHHTSRAIRVMLKVALTPVVNKSRQLKRKTITFNQEFENLLGLSSQPRRIGIKEVLTYIQEWTDEHGVEIIKMINERNYYKRILTIHYTIPVQKGKPTLWEKFRTAINQPMFQEILQKNIAKQFFASQSLKDHRRPSILVPDTIDNVNIKLMEPNTIICDSPDPSYGSKGNLSIIPEPKRFQRNYSNRVKTAERVSEVWNQAYFILMNIASKCRVFCHPDVRDALMVSLGPEEIRKCVEDAINQIM